MAKQHETDTSRPENVSDPDAVALEDELWHVERRTRWLCKCLSDLWLAGKKRRIGYAQELWFDKLSESTREAYGAWTQAIQNAIKSAQAERHTLDAGSRGSQGWTVGLIADLLMLRSCMPTAVNENEPAMLLVYAARDNLRSIDDNAGMFGDEQPDSPPLLKVAAERAIQLIEGPLRRRYFELDAMRLDPAGAADERQRRRANDTEGLYPAVWYVEASGGILSATQLNRAREDGHIAATKYEDGKWRYPLRGAGGEKGVLDNATWAHPRLHRLLENAHQAGFVPSGRRKQK